MIEKRLGIQMPAAEQWWVVGSALALAVGLGMAVARFGLGWRELLILLFGIVAVLAILVPNDRVFGIGLGLGVVSIAFGWRTFSITPDLSFAPFEFIVWFLAGAFALKQLVRRERLKFQLSVPMTLFLFFCIPAFLVAWSKGILLDSIIGYGKNVVMVAPFFFVIQNLVRDLRTWKRIIFVAIGVSVYLNFTGLISLVAPSLGEALAARLLVQSLGTGDFTRVGFAGWGPLAAWFFILVFGVVLGFWGSAQNRTHRLIYLAILLILGAGILASGQRGAWVALIAGLIVYGAMNPRRGISLVLLLGVLIFLLPEWDFAARFASAFDPSLYDSSAFDRYNRARIALSTIADNPILGLGFGAFTFVHSDYLEIGAGMGVIALGLFVAALGVTGWRLVKIQLSAIDHPARSLARGALVMFVILAIEMLSAGFITLSFTTVVTWFFWAMSDQFAALAEESQPV